MKSVFEIKFKHTLHIDKNNLKTNKIIGNKLENKLENKMYD